MATPETRTGQVEADALPKVEERKSAKRFITGGWWIKRYRELSWAWRFNLAILILASLSALAFRTTDAFGWSSAAIVAKGCYYAVLSMWIPGAIVQLFLFVRQSFTATRSQPPTDAINE